MVVVGAVRRVRGVAAAVAVGDGDAGVCRLRGRVHGRTEVGEARRLGLDHHDLAVGAGGRDGVEIERLLLRPPDVVARQAGATGLVDHAEAAVRRRTGRQAVLGAVDAQVALEVGVAVGVDDRDRPTAAAGAVEVIARCAAGSGDRADASGAVAIGMAPFLLTSTLA